MFSQILKILKAIGYKNQLSALFIILISFFIILLELLSFTLIIPALSITLDNDVLNNIPIVGFFVTAVVFLFLSSWLLLGRPRQIGALFKSALFAVATTVVLWFLFTQVLQLSMPEGLFF